MESELTFGNWLKRRRRAMDLTRATLAAQVGCSVSALRKFEADTLRPSQTLAVLLAGALDLAPQDQPAFVRFARDAPGDAAQQVPLPPIDLPPTLVDDPPPPVPSVELPPPAPVRFSLPVPLTPLIGRAHEVALVCTTLADMTVRLVTLIGPGGIGKTRVALQAAAELETSYPDGVVFVDLTPIADPTLVATSIAQALGVTEIGGQSLSAVLAHHLRDKRCLLVLDNFEQVVEAAPVVAELLHAAPSVQALLTSRFVVGVYGEHLIDVPPLPFPAAGRLPPQAQLGDYDAIRLFSARAHAMQSTFALADDNAEAVAAICAQLDGLPLAIELAAARVRLLSPPQILARLTQRLLVGGARSVPARQQTLRATIAWSYDLLDAREQALFRRVSVFVGGSTLEAIEGVCDSADDRGLPVFDTLAGLVEKSLVQQTHGVDGVPRFTMLETIREYALEHLTDSGELEALRQRHAAFFVTLAETIAPELYGPQQVLWMDRLEMEHSNLRAALAWCRTEADGTTGLRLVVALESFWAIRSYMHEARGWITEALSPRADGASWPTSAASRGLRAKALGQLGVRATWQSDLAAAQPALEESLALYRELGDTWNTADILSDLGMVSLFRGDYTRSSALLEESLSLFQQLDDTNAVSWSFLFRGTLVYVQGDLKGAADLWEQGLALTRPFEIHSWGIATYLGHLGLVALDQGDYAQSRGHLHESLTRLRDLGDRWQTTRVLEVCAGLAAAQGHQGANAQVAGRSAAQLFGAAEALREALGAPLMPIYHDHYQRGITATRALLDEATFAAAWAAGRAMTLEQAIVAALDVTAAPVMNTNEIHR